MEETTERWLPVVGYEGYYEVSDQGRVRSLPHLVYAGTGRWGNADIWRQTKARLLSLYFGDHYVKVRLKRDGEGRTCNVHQLVAAAFLGPCPPGMEVCHNNGTHHDNRIANLRYDTHSANQLDKARHGTDPYASRTHCNYGHEFTEDNIYRRLDSSNARKCRTCERIRSAAREARRKEVRRARRLTAPV